MTTTAEQEHDAARRRARIEALELIAAQLEAAPFEVDVDDPTAVIAEMSKIAAVFLSRSFGAVTDPAASARRWVAFAINQETANLAELAGEQGQ